MSAIGQPADIEARHRRPFGRWRVILAGTNICSYIPSVLYLRRRDSPETEPWWAEIERYPHAAPGLVPSIVAYGRCA
jgi:hypothetical protein